MSVTRLILIESEMYSQLIVCVWMVKLTRDGSDIEGCVIVFVILIIMSMVRKRIVCIIIGERGVIKGGHWGKTASIGFTFAVRWGVSKRRDIG